MATAPNAFVPLAEVSREVASWVTQVAGLTTPDQIHWCDGSPAETARLRNELIARKELSPLNEKTFPDCHIAYSHPSDVARVEHLTFICTKNQEDAGPNNNWMAPDEAKAQMNALYKGCMKGRTLYVVPYCMGPIDSPYSRCGVEITDSAYVVLNMGIMTRMGRPALERIAADGGKFVKGLHSVGELDPNRRFIMHFPEELSIQSFGSGYGGNALLGKKCHALRIASYQARTEGWLAEHMLIVGLKSPKGELHYVACAFPSACGKTNLAMLIPPATMPGWEVFTVGDDICWMQPGPDGRLWAINPESGYFGVAPGTSPKTNKNAYDMIRKDTLFTNVALTADNEPWWEGIGGGTPVTDWQGRPYDAKNGPAAHPNARFTVSAVYNPAYTKEAENPKGVPISAIVFGGRRREIAPLVYEARSWQHGVLVGASVASETTAAATGAVGVVRRDSMAMKPFCGYNFGDYFQHWLNVGAKLKNPPKIFHVNWFRQGSDGKFLWPGFGDNLRVLSWMLERVAGRAGAKETAIGNLPRPEDLNLAGLDIKSEVVEELLSVKQDAWRKEAADIRTYLGEFGARTPKAMYAELDGVEQRLS
ncbi:MAG: phosphoenolpyruvate carboxykinase (GTP) [Proteobacteria bacterium]|nr:phosphoenolpyruvate carboxykinase (GTP) [Pseudomonadota bacterium]MBK7114741.1 phosphoenolpyruvate carboxykinase (GTP) [Pseudomonadota bacterium]MBK9251042.1 phosphoenolpyruvate carboxykinase (GTP) [Pseudomonadota bacterium]MCC6632469.1 phosphoenolpyruvate carboxykinase (GTP) [Gammaproteobacteria bacterium]